MIGLSTEEMIAEAEGRVAGYDWRFNESARDSDEERAFLKLSMGAQAELEELRKQLPRNWILREEGFDYDEIEAESVEEAIEVARGNVDRGNYPDAEGTIWIDVSVRCEETDEEESSTVQLDEDEPACKGDASHDWQSPHEILGGLAENPGVWGHGGGVIIHEVCVLCGCERSTDTWAQRHDNGQQGLTSVTYEEGKYADEVAHARAEKVSIDLANVVVARVDGARVYAAVDHAGHDEEDCGECEDCDAVIEEIRDSLPEGWSASWTGNGNGTESDVVIQEDS
jgi:hypothetical protein